jgi:hypothetical protein
MFHVKRFHPVTAYYLPDVSRETSLHYLVSHSLLIGYPLVYSPTECNAILYVTVSSVPLGFVLLLVGICTRQMLSLFTVTLVSVLWALVRFGCMSNTILCVTVGSVRILSG